MFLRIISVFFLLITNLLSAKVLIISSAYNRPDLIEIQNKCIKKFVLDDYEQIIFNDAEIPKYEAEINLVCQKLNIKCIRVPQGEVHKNHQEPAPGWNQVFSFKSKEGTRLPYRVNFRCGEVLQFAHETIASKHDGIVVIMDLDCFPIRPTSFEQMLDGHLMGGTIWRMPPNIAGYPMPILMLFDMANLPHKEAINFNSGFVGSQWFDLCALLQFYVYCHDIKIKDCYTQGHVHCATLGKKYSRADLLKMGYDENTINFVKRYYQKLFVDLGYVHHVLADIETPQFKQNKRSIMDQGQILEWNFFHFNQCTNWMGAYDKKFMSAKTRLVKEFVWTITKD